MVKDNRHYYAFAKRKSRKKFRLERKKAWCLFYYSVKAGIVENNN